MARKAKPRSKLTPETHKTIIEAIKMGASKTDAAGVAGVSRRVIYNWIEQGENQEAGIYRAFLDDMELASSRGVVKLLKVLQDDIEAGGVETAKWLLSKIRQGEFGTNKMELNHTGEQVITLGWGDSEDNSS